MAAKGWKRFIYDEEVPQPSVAVGTGTPVASPSTIQPIYLPTGPSALTTPGSVKSDMLAQVRKTVYNKTTAYARLLDMADKMKGAVPDETMRLRAAIPVVSVTATDIKAAIAEHVQALHAVRTAFAQDAQRNRTNTIDSKKTRRTAIAVRSAELEQELGTLRTEDTQLAGAIGTAEAQFSQTEADFAATTLQVEQELATADSKLSILFT